MLNKYIKKLEDKAEIYIRVKARPGAAATAIRGVMESDAGETVKIDVAAPAEKGKANEELVKFLAICFSVARTAVKIISGAGEKIKLVKIIKTN